LLMESFPLVENQKFDLMINLFGKSFSIDFELCRSSRTV